MTHPLRHLILPMAGRATRLMPLTKAVNKALLPVYHKPVLQYALDEASVTELDQLIFVISPDDRSIEDYFRPDDALIEKLQSQQTPQANEALALFAAHDSWHCHYVPQPQPTGLGDAVLRGWQADVPHVAVILSDDLILTDAQSPLQTMMQAHHATDGAIILLCEEVSLDVISRYGVIAPAAHSHDDPIAVTSLEVISRYGVIAPAAHSHDDLIAVTSLVEKPVPAEAPSRLAVIGRYVLPRAVRDCLQKTGAGAGGEIQLTDAINDAIAHGTPAFAVTLEGTRYDCGSLSGLMAAAHAVRQQS